MSQNSKMDHVFFIEKAAEDESSQAVVSAQNGSPRLNRAENTTRPAPQEAYDVHLQRKENEGFGFVILTSKNKPPPGGKGQDCCLLFSLGVPIFFLFPLGLGN